MSYYTDFKLSVFYGTADLHAVKQALLELVETDQEGRQLFDQIDDGDTEIRSFGEIKWYDHHLDCCELSRLFPGVIFKLEGVGMIRGDDWFAYYKDGLAQLCRGETVYPKFDPNGFKEPLDVETSDEGRFYWYEREVVE